MDCQKRREVRRYESDGSTEANNGPKRMKMQDGTVYVIPQTNQLAMKRAKDGSLRPSLELEE